MIIQPAHQDFSGYPLGLACSLLANSWECRRMEDAQLLETCQLCSWVGRSHGTLCCQRGMPLYSSKDTCRSVPLYSCLRSSSSHLIEVVHERCGKMRVKEFCSAIQQFENIVPSSTVLPNPGMEPRSPTLQVESLPAEPPGKTPLFSVLPEKHIHNLKVENYVFFLEIFRA